MLLLLLLQYCSTWEVDCQSIGVLDIAGNHRRSDDIGDGRPIDSR